MAAEPDRAPDRIWWRTARGLTAIAALLGAVIPGTAAINGWLHIRLERQAQRHEIRLEYLDRAIDPERDAEYRESVLTFLIDTFDRSDPMKSWAENQLSKIQLVLQLRGEVEARQGEVRDLQVEIAKERTRRLQSEEDAKEREDSLEQSLADKETELAAIRRRLMAAEREANTSERDAAQLLYNTAYADLSKGNYDLAISGFREYETRYPLSPLADNALYWIGECYFSRGDYTDAISAFEELHLQYPDSDRAAAAHLRIGRIHLNQENRDQATVKFRHVQNRFPGTDEAIVAGDLLRDMGR